MKLGIFKSVLYSSRDYVQFVIVYDSEKRADIESGCTAEYAINKYGDREVKRIEAFENQLVITL